MKSLLENIDTLLEGTPWEYGKSLDELGHSKRKVIAYRAMPASADTIRSGDYITMSLKFAKDHAVTSSVYNQEPFQVGRAFLLSEDVVGARNAGEYIYEGSRPAKVDTLYVSDEHGDIRRSK